MSEYLTELGKQTYELVKDYGLGAYYDPYSGNILVDKDDITNRILNRIAIFLAENTDWVMGAQYTDADAKDGVFFYISPKEDL